MTILPSLRIDSVPADPDEAAAYWVARRHLGLISPREEARFSAWLDDPINAAAFHAAAAPFEALGDLAAAPEIRRMRDMALAAAPPKPAVPWRRMAAALAAVLVAVVVLFLLAEVRRTPGTSRVEDSGIVLADAAGQRHETAVGERLDVTLDDGSVVTLNTASLVEVAYSESLREVRLIRGQALFRVARGQPRPFVVLAGDRRITATGTAFDVRLDGPSVKVVLIEGRVEVAPARPAPQRTAPALDRQEMSPGEQLVAVHGAPVRVTPIDVEQATSWRRGQVVFHDEPLSAAVVEMNRYSPVQMVIDDPRVANLRISGVFGVARGENFQAAVAAYHPVEVHRRSEGVAVLAWREDG